MDADSIAVWMLAQIHTEACLYQDDVVDHLVKAKREDLLTTNADGNQVIGKGVLAAFRKLTPDIVVWVKPDRYWRFRVAEDEPGRDARG
ncbi:MULTISPECIES: DUF6953 family protein [unclassified Pseudomonas]|uniref:DUF6953 family protein n=1 Tax=unclassified Pseudomonas TaxID=196821 RepID=UPI0028AD138E|nr:MULTISPECIES: hypothetical protein [unclassified Pseudomonas]MEB0108414.1 hypothetical protein [Pseudomonas sp. MH9.3]WPX81379.1 hypothetical protein RHM60_09790 [Pseudomonas sp. MH9.3]WQG56971.1 hypothetical protein RHM66_16925 [Pseudomonas sp. RTB3]